MIEHQSCSTKFSDTPMCINPILFYEKKANGLVGSRFEGSRARPIAFFSLLCGLRALRSAPPPLGASLGAAKMGPGVGPGLVLPTLRVRYGMVWHVWHGLAWFGPCRCFQKWVNTPCWLRSYLCFPLKPARGRFPMFIPAPNWETHLRILFRGHGEGKQTTL